MRWSSNNTSLHIRGTTWYLQQESSMWWENDHFGRWFQANNPVVTKGSRANIVVSLISVASFWCYCNVQHLRINVRLMHSNLSLDEHERLWSFIEWMLNVGNGSIQRYSFLGGSESDWIEIPKEFLINNNSNGLKHLIEFVYPCIVDRYKDASYS